MEPQEIHRQIRSAGFLPAKRDTDYNVLHVYVDPAEDATLASMTEIRKGAQPDANWQPISIIE
jgi:hypothetical protein